MEITQVKLILVLLARMVQHWSQLDRLVMDLFLI